MCFIAGEHTWILSEPDPGMEVPVTATDRQVNGTLLQSLISGECTHYIASIHHDVRSQTILSLHTGV